MSKVTKSTLTLMIATMIGKVLGFGRELALASSYGTTVYSDAYIIALNIPMVLFTTIAYALGTTFIPIYYDIEKKYGQSKCILFTNNIFNIVAMICIILATLGFLFTEPLVKVFAMGFEGETLHIAVDFTKTIIIGVLFIGLSNVMTSYLQVNDNFTVPGLIGIPKNLIIIISIILSINYGPMIMIWGTLIGMISEVIFQLPFAAKYGYKYSLYLNLKDRNVIKVIGLLGPVFIGIGINQINAIIDRTIASTLGTGSISALNYANKLNQFIISVFIVSIISVIYPRLSRLISENNRKDFVNLIYTSVNSILLLVVPISIGAIVLCEPIVKILFERGEFDSVATKMTSMALAFYSVGLIASALRDILGKVFFSIKDTKTPMINGSIAMIFNIIFNLILGRLMGHAGLALATSISSTICIVLLFNSLKKKIGYYGQDKIRSTFIKSLCASILMGIITKLVYNLCIQILGYENTSILTSIIISIFIGTISYGMLVIALKVNEINLIIDIIKSKVRKFNSNKELI